MKSAVRLSSGFWRLWTGEGVSSLGSQVTLVALPLTAVSYLNASTTMVGVLQAASFIPILVFGLPAGAIADRQSSSALLRWSYCGRAVLIAVIPVAAAAGFLNIYVLLAVALLASSLTVFGDVAVQSTLPDTVGVEALTTANARMGLMQAIAATCGPALAGILISIFTAPSAMAVDAASFVLAAAVLWTLRTPAHRSQKSAGGALFAEIGEGVRIVVRHPLLRSIVLAAGTLNLFSGVFLALEVLFMVRILHFPAAAIGFLFALQGVTAVLVSFVVARWTRRLGVGRTLLIGLLIEGFSSLAFALSTGTRTIAVVWVAVALIINALVAPLFNVNAVSLRQAITPRRLLGRVNASSRMMIMGSRPLGSVIGGALATAVGVRPVLIVASLGMILGCGWLAGSRITGLRTLAEARPVESEETQPTPEGVQ